MAFFRSSTVPQTLKQSPLGQALPKAELRRLRELSTIIDVPEGDTIIAQATPGRECFVVVDGTFAATVGNDRLKGSIEAGEVAGELALLTGKARNASVTATSDAIVCVMHPREFASLLSQADCFCSQVLASAQERLNGEQVTLPAQFVPGVRASGPPASPWSQRLGEHYAPRE